MTADVDVLAGLSDAEVVAGLVGRGMPAPIAAGWVCWRSCVGGAEMLAVLLTAGGTEERP